MRSSSVFSSGRSELPLPFRKGLRLWFEGSFVLSAACQALSPTHYPKKPSGSEQWHDSGTIWEFSHTGNAKLFLAFRALPPTAYGDFRGDQSPSGLPTVPAKRMPLEGHAIARYTNRMGVQLRDRLEDLMAVCKPADVPHCGG
jgi:hypothetical protein